MHTLKINIFFFLFSCSAYSSSSKKSVSAKNKKNPSENKISKEPSTENNLPSLTENTSIYYLPVHLM